MKQAGREELLAFLRDIDARLDGEGLKSGIDFYVLGGAAAVAAYGAPRGTTDIDALIDDERIQRKLGEWAGPGKELALKHGIYFQSANLTLMLLEDPDWRGRCVEMFRDKLRHLRVMAAGKEDLILSKLSRYNDRDREDIRFIAERHKIDVRKLIAYYQAARGYFVGHLPTLDQTFNIVLGEHFGRKPVKFDDK